MRILMKYFMQWALDEKVIISSMAIFFALCVILFVHWGADKEYVSIFGSAVTMLIGALLRGITHQISTNGTEKPKE
jgi:hypothetical protein